MDTNATTRIAGEPLEPLLRGLAAMEFAQQDNGLMHVEGRLDPEPACAWSRAIERYGADFITPGNQDTPPQRHADAFVRILEEIGDTLDTMLKANE